MSDTKEPVVIFDTTLRDGEQSPGATMNRDEKLEVARALERLGVDVIEAGFPIASRGDFESVRAIAAQCRRARVAGLARSLEKDIDRAVESVAPAGERGRVHVFLATSAIHRQYKLGKAKDEILRLAREATAYAKARLDDVEFSPEDASRTEPEFLAQVVEAVIEAGATTVNIPDTVGYAYPEDFGRLIAYLREEVPNIERAVISVHCHDDLGLAVANSLAAVDAGARQVECTINGIGERAGNAAVEELVMAMRLSRDRFAGLCTNIVSEQFYPTSRLVLSVTGLPMARNKAVVGDNAFAHESGVHQHGVIRNPETYEIMTPQSVGMPAGTMVLGKHSGKAALNERLAGLGFDVDEEQLLTIFEAFKDLADRKKEVFDADLIALVEQLVRGRSLSRWHLDHLHISAGSGGLATATVRMRRNGDAVTEAATGDGPVDAIINVMDRIVGIQGKLTDYRLRAVTAGRDALGEVSLRVDIDGITVGGKGLSTDVVEASAIAYLDAINRVQAVRERGATFADDARP